MIQKIKQADVALKFFLFYKFTCEKIIKRVNYQYANCMYIEWVHLFKIIDYTIFKIESEKQLYFLQIIWKWS
jgi:hypothetical protein